jgi:dihydroorotate dehydrogenase (NAD+) catalytic subunit
VKQKKRVVTSPGIRVPGTRRQPTVRRFKPAIMPVTPSRPTGRSSVPPPDDPPDSATVDLSVHLGRGLVLPNPILVAAGTFGYGVEHADASDIQRLGGIVTRGTTLKARVGNAPPRMAETAGGILNGVGLPNPGIDVVIDRYAGSWAAWRVPVVVNVAGSSVGEYVEVLRRLEGVNGVAAVELNLSCPNVAIGGALFAGDADAAAALTAAARRATDLPVLVKLSANVTDVRSVARAVADAGADAISAINTVAGLAVAQDRTRTLLGSGYGGLSGPAVKPIAMRVVYEVAQVVDIPVIAVGGVTAIDDVLDFLAVGASAVQVGTANFADPGLAASLVAELAAECRARGLASCAPLVGSAVPRRPVASSAKGVEYRP